MTGRALTVIVVCVVLGALAGVATTWLLVSAHAISPDNVAAGAALGFGGVIAGQLAALILLTCTTTATKGNT